MVLLVPDDVEEDVARKAQLDDSAVGKATQKVDLDLDDAPFLEDEDDEEIIEDEEVETPLFEEDASNPQGGLLALLKNKLVLSFAAVILLLLAVIMFLVLREPAPPPPPPPPVEATTAPDEAAPAVAETPEILIRLDPFLIEQRDEKGQIRFLEVRVLVSTEDDGLSRQFKQETYAVRNALFYYLKNKDLQFLSDKENAEKLKKELGAVPDN